MIIREYRDMKQKQISNNFYWHFIIAYSFINVFQNYILNKHQSCSNNKLQDFIVIKLQLVDKMFYNQK